MSGALFSGSAASVFFPLTSITPLASAPYAFSNGSTLLVPSGYTTLILSFPLPSSVTTTLIVKAGLIGVTPSPKLLSASTTSYTYVYTYAASLIFFVAIPFFASSISSSVVYRIDSNVMFPSLPFLPVVTTVSLLSSTLNLNSSATIGLFVRDFFALILTFPSPPRVVGSAL